VRIAVVGAGGVGGYFGGRWAQAGRDVTFLARGPHLEALRSRGLRLVSPLGDAAIPVMAAGSPQEVGPVDLVVLATKSWQMEAAAEELGPMVGPGTLLFGLQNGVEASEVLSRFVPPDQVLGGTCRIISYVESPGVIRHAGVEPTLLFGELSGSRPGVAASVLEQLQGVEGVTLRAAEDILTEIWRKFVFFAPVSGIGSVTRAPMGVIRGVPPVRRLLESAVREVYEVGRALGVRLPETVLAEAMRFIDAVPADGTNSMQRDFRDGRRTELEQLSGAVARLGPQAGVAVPVHTFLYTTLLPLEWRARGTLEFSRT